MSRLYDAQIEVTFPVDKKEKLEKEICSKLVDFLGDETNEIIAMLENKLEIQGTRRLSGGQTTEEAHEEIKEEIKNLDQDIQIVTKWHLSEWNWEDVFED